ncbi:MAG: hypothetical protein RLZZ135_1581 [Cyanobacteriota bacterium]|jgi:predicted enzyme related to lactoylglutathione lyase
MNTLPTKLDFVALQVRNLEASRSFYVNTLDFEVGQSPSPDTTVVFADAAGAIFALRKPLIDLSTVPQLGIGISLWFAVSNAKAAYDRSTQTGATIIQPIKDSPFGQMFSLLDLDGYSITVHQQ